MSQVTAGTVQAQAAETPVEHAAHAHACANCGVSLQGAFCHACGQRGHLHGRLWHLIEEFAEGLAHFDGRLWRTLPLLAFKPGKLSREWRLGRRVRYVAPLHLFLFAVFLMFLVPSLTGQHIVAIPDGTLEAPGISVRLGQEESPEATDWLRRVLADAAKKSPEFIAYKIEGYAYKLSFMLVPISVLILALLLAFKRGFTFYDHAVVSLYGLGFLALLVTALTPLKAVWSEGPEVVGGVWAGAHAVAHLKGAYELSTGGAMARTFALLMLSVFGFAIFILGVVALGLLG